MSDEGMTDVDLGPAEDPLSLLGAVRRAPPPPLPMTRAPPPPPPDSPDTMLRKALGGGPKPPPKAATPLVKPAPRAAPKPAPPPPRDWATLLGFEGAAPIQPPSTTASSDLQRRARAAPPHTALGACARNGSLDVVAAVARAYDADGLRDAAGASALAVALAHGDAGQALLLLRAATRRLGFVADATLILDACGAKLATTDPELVEAWPRLASTARAFLDGAFSALHVKDAAALWAALAVMEDRLPLASAALAAACIRGRVALLDEGPIVVSDTPGLINEARWLLEPETQPGVAVSKFGEGPLGILLTKRPRGLVVSSFSRPRAEAVPRVGDALCAVNGRQVPRDSTLNDAVAILKGVGRPVLVAFRPATSEELRAERPPAPSWPVERQVSPPPKAVSDLQALASYARSAVETVTEAPPVDHGELPPGPSAMPPPLTTAPLAADGWAVATLPGEVLFARTNARLPDFVRSRAGSNQLSGCRLDGELHVTSYRVVFHPIGCGATPSFASSTSDWEMPVRALTACSLTVGPGGGHRLALKCKDGQRRVFTCAHRDGAAALSCARAVHALAFSSASDAFARAHRAAVEPDPRFVKTLPATAAYSLHTEYAACVLRGPAKDGLRIIKNEHALDVCETYPLELVVPATTTDLELRRVAAYRSKGRLPAVIWSHPTNGATISRSSQPKPGVQNKRSSDDERYLSALRRLAQGQKMVIVDARSKIATQANRVMGAGTELTRYYDGVEMFYGNIANIHAARDALSEVQKLVRETSGGDVDTGGATFWGKLDGTKWLSQVHSILAAAVKTVEVVHYERSAVLVHCSDGWDRTPQITCLALMLLEKRFRTIDGFTALLQKEWADFGHKFDERCGHTDESASDQRSPVFLLFIDCCFQLLQQFPSAFEFSEDLLLLLLDQFHACRFGSFLENNERRRRRKDLDGATLCAWRHVARHFEGVRNKGYDSEQDDSAPLLPSLHARNVRLFEPYFRRFDAARVPLAPARTFY